MCGCQWREGLAGSGLMHQTYPLVTFHTMIRVKPLGIKLGTIFENDVPHGRIISCLNTKACATFLKFVTFFSGGLGQAREVNTGLL